MKVFITTDMEGISGCVTGGYGQSIGAVAEEYLDLMLGEINAVVEGCVQAGVEEIIVGEAHHVDLRKLHAKAKLSRGIPWHDALKLRKFDAALFVGQHARTDLANAVRSHTGSSNSIIGFWINGKPAGELAYIGGFLGAINIPVIFLSGDTAACNEAQELISGSVITIEVEESHNVHGALCFPPSQTHPLLINGVARAFQEKDNIKPIKFDTPVTFKIEFKYSKIADEFCYVPNVQRVNARTISFTGETYEEAYMVGVAVLGLVLTKYDR